MNRVARRHYQSQFVSGLDAARKGADAARAKKWREAFEHYELAVDCFRQSKHPAAREYLVQATRCFGTIGGIILEQEADRESAAVELRREYTPIGELPTYEGLLFAPVIGGLEK